jgi:hypothetical protein
MKVSILTPLSRVVFQKPTVPQQAKISPAIYENYRFTVLFTIDHHMSLSYRTFKTIKLLQASRIFNSESRKEKPHLPFRKYHITISTSTNICTE